MRHLWRNPVNEYFILASLWQSMHNAFLTAYLFLNTQVW